jgi:non-specific serine/threonine protein kinase
MGCEIERVYRFELDHWLESACDAIGAALAAEALRTGRASTRAAAIAEATNVVQGIADGHVASAEGSPGTVRDLLSAREKEVAILIGRGLTNRQIAEELVIAQRTAAHHVENILDKLGLTSRLQIARWVIENYASE